MPSPSGDRCREAAEGGPLAWGTLRSRPLLLSGVTRVTEDLGSFKEKSESNRFLDKLVRFHFREKKGNCIGSSFPSKPTPLRSEPTATRWGACTSKPSRLCFGNGYFPLEIRESLFQLEQKLSKVLHEGTYDLGFKKYTSQFPHSTGGRQWGGGVRRESGS